MDEQEGALQRAFVAYEQARAHGDRAELVLARLTLCSALTATGWEAPPEVRDQLWRDRRVLRELEQAALPPGEPVRRTPSHRPATSPRAAARA